MLLEMRCPGLRSIPLLAVALISSERLLQAQEQQAMFDYEKSQTQIASVTGLWRFHTGDDPKWADPSFNDSSWQLIRSDEPWSQQGHPEYAGFAWYRFSIRFPAGEHEWSILMPYIRNSYQLFAGGRLIGSCGTMPPHQQIVDLENRIFRLPAEHGGGKSVLIAIRVWSIAEGTGGGPSGQPWVGEPKPLQQTAREANIAERWGFADVICLVLVFVLAGAGSLFLFLLRQSEREYLWFALYGLGNAGMYALSPIALAYPGLPVIAFSFVQGICFTVKDLAMILFAGSLLKAHRDKVLRMSAFVALAIFAEWELFNAFLMVTQQPVSATGYRAFLATIALLDLVLYLGIIYTILRAVRRRVADARLLLYPFAISYAAVIFGEIRQLTYVYGRHWLAEHTAWYNSLTSVPFNISLKDITEFLAEGALLGMLVLRFARTRRDEERLENELAAARAVQQVLIPEETPQPPGFSVQSAYHPASQVGGDFFQILSTCSGGVIVVVGDVSGKGMPAAMTVSLLVGAARTLAEITESPPAILNGLNRRAVSHSSGGFTTCLCCRIAPDGTAIFANAGHLSPYLDGQELELATGLPLGLEAEAEYEETVIHLPENARLTFLSDGVVEAKSDSGELFGFERACELSLRSAEEIAQAAKAFGQEDDITVLTLARAASPKVLTA